MTRRITVIQPHEFFDFPSNEEDSSSNGKPMEESDENFYEAFNATNLALFWSVIMLLSYILAFTIAILVIICDQKEMFLPHHFDDGFKSIATGGSNINTPTN